MKKIIADLVVIGNDKIGDSYFLLTLQSKENLPVILPAQFAEVKIENAKNTFLRRPISIHDVDYENKTIKFLIKIAGEGTLSLSKLCVKETLNVVFPIGNTFKQPISGKVLLVGGGVGVAPMLYTAKYFSKFNVESDILFGYRSESNILRKEVYEKYATVYYSTDDGSYGEKGTVMNHSIFSKEEFPYSKIFACGPEPMMRSIGSWSKMHNVECEVSLENKMACGLGACLCCVQNTVAGHKCVCSDGPVFNVKDLLW